MSIEKIELLKHQIRKTPFTERLVIARTMIEKMCREGRPPKVSIPANHTDEDFFIITTLDDALAFLSSPTERDEVVRLLEQIYAGMPNLPGESSSESLLLWVREWAIEKMGGGEDEGWAWLRRKIISAFPDGLTKPRTDDLIATKYEVMGWMHIICYRALGEKLFIQIAQEQEKRADEQEKRASAALKLLERAAAMMETGELDMNWHQEYQSLIGEQAPTS